MGKLSDAPRSGTDNIGLYVSKYGGGVIGQGGTVVAYESKKYKVEFVQDGKKDYGCFSANELWTNLGLAELQGTSLLLCAFSMFP